MLVFTLLLAVVATSTKAANDNAYVGDDYSSRQASQGANSRSGSGGGQPVSYRTRGGVGGTHSAGAQVGAIATLDGFGSAPGAGAAETALQRGTANVSERDRAISRAHEQANRQQRHFDNADAGAGRQDNQERKGNLRQNAFKNQDQRLQDSQSHRSNSFDQSHDLGAERGQKQIDLNDKHAGGLQSNGRYNRKDVAANAGNKALSASKNAFTHRNKGFENLDYGFNKDFKTNFNERGGLKEAVGQANTNTDVYEENQKGNHLFRGFQDIFRKSNGNNAFRKESDWLSNAAQSQNVNNKYGAADRLQDAAQQKNADLNALFDRRNDVFRHQDTARDKALREASDLARKEADQRKKTLAEATSKKDVEDSKYYGGGSFGSGSPMGINNLPIAGQSGPGPQTGTVSNPYTNTGSGPVSAGGIVQGGNTAGSGLGTSGQGKGLGTSGQGKGLGTSGQGKGRQEESGGEYLNQYGEKGRQADQGGQKEASQAQSDAKALNDYNRGRGVDDSIEVNVQRQGKWSKDGAGLRDAQSQGFNDANADAAKRSQLLDKGLDHHLSNSNLEATNKNLQDQELDRINYKRNQVDSNQKVRKLKKFYHDKNEDGHNNEALNYNRDQGSQETGEEQQAHKEARTSYNNSADDAKVNHQDRAYSNLDARKISNADAFSRQKDNAGGWKNTNQQTDPSAQKNKAAADKSRQNSEFDSFASSITSRNQQLWDKASKDLASRDRGSQRDRSLDAAFAFLPHRANNALSLGGGQNSRGIQTSGRNRSFGGAPTFGRSATSFGSSRVPSSGHRGSTFDDSDFSGSSFGGSKFSGSSFGGRFGNSVANFMEDIGSTKFGQFSFDQSGSNSGSSTFGASTGNQHADSNRRWRRK